LRQSFDNFELLIVNDASTDETNSILDDYDDARIRVVTNADKLGLTKSLNRGLSEARGKYVARIDDDDIWPEKKKLFKQVALLEGQVKIGVCGTQNIVINEQGEELYQLQYPTQDADIRKGMLARNLLVHSSVLIRKSSLDVVGFYDEEYKYAQDYELWLRIGRNYELANLEDVYIKQRVNPRGITSRKNMRQFLAFVQIAFRYRNEYPRYWSNLPLYGRELLVNLVPKPVFYRIGGVRRRLS